LDRIDLHVELESVPIETISTNIGASQEDESHFIAQITIGRDLQLKRGIINARAGSSEIKKYFQVESSALSLLERASQRLNLSARSALRIIKVARTIADLEQAKNVEAKHLAEAISFRKLERIKEYCIG
jgi:magnesium chelatase family protein